MQLAHINTDLELWSTQDLSIIADELGERISVLYNDFADEQYLLCLEVVNNTESPDDAINEFCDLYELLSEKAKSHWKNCDKKALIIGYESGNDKNQNRLEHNIPLDTLERVTRAKLDLGICIYPSNMRRIP